MRRYWSAPNAGAPIAAPMDPNNLKVTGIPAILYGFSFSLKTISPF